MLDKAVNTALSLLDTEFNDRTPSREEIESTAKFIYSKLKDKVEFSYEDLVQKLVTRYAIVWEESNGILGKSPHEDWLPVRRPDIKWEYWDRYRSYLITKKGWTPSQLATLDKDTDKLLSQMENPLKSGSWFRRGMIVGDVQSGKTANYTGVLNKAIDSGYKLIIVLAGIHNSLRSQTQNRLDKELVGYDSLEQVWFGVGEKGNKLSKTIQQITNSSENGDLRSRQRNSPVGHDPVLLVIKKNKTPLESIINWIKGQVTDSSGILKNVPTVVIDDESDQASVNTNDEETNPTTINRLIREMLGALDQKNYVGYTATPFANIYIRPGADDIFPEDFIFRIRPPSNYIGATRFFGIKGDRYADIEQINPLPLYIEVTDQNTFLPRGHRNSANPEHLPESLIEAINSFLLSCSIRAIRQGDENHNTMLIHVTRFNEVQERVWEKVRDLIDSYVQIFRYDSGNGIKNLKTQFMELYKSYENITNQLNKEPDLEPTSLPPFEEVFKKVFGLIERIEVKQINGTSADVLNYKPGKGSYVIAVGGNKLSRGLTLEGLSVSYYLRSSLAYDTLLQMGRWFGYRPGYLDLCRIYTNNELFNAYSFISLAAEELNREFEKLEKRNATPKEWGLKVRSHPESSIIITAANKMRSSQNLEWSFSEKLVQTLSLSLENELPENNFRAYKKLRDDLNSVKEPLKHPNRPVYVWKDISPTVVSNFFKDYRTHKRSPGAETSVLDNYLQKSNSVGELISWTIAIIGGEADLEVEVTPQIKVKGVTRVGNYAFDEISPATIYRSIISKEDEALDFEEYKSKVFGADLRELRSPKNGLLLIYPISAKSILEKFRSKYPENRGNSLLKNTEVPLVAFAISMPRSDHMVSVQYTVNEVMMKAMGFDEEEIDEIE